MNALAAAHRNLGDYDFALRNVLSAALHNMGEHDEAASLAQRALEQHRRCGYRLGEAWALTILSNAVSDLDSKSARLPYRIAAQRLFAEIGVPQPDAFAWSLPAA